MLQVFVWIRDINPCGHKKCCPHMLVTACCELNRRIMKRPDERVQLLKKCLFKLLKLLQMGIS